jgi:hypothetical protein
VPGGVLGRPLIHLRRSFNSNDIIRYNTMYQWRDSFPVCRHSGGIHYLAFEGAEGATSFLDIPGIGASDTGSEMVGTTANGGFKS